MEAAYDYLTQFEKRHGSGLQRDFDDDDFLNNDILDPVKLANMKKEPQRGKDELFDEYGGKTTDFVGLVQRSIQAAEKEENLYLSPSEQQAKAFIKASSRPDNITMSKSKFNLPEL